MNLMTLFSISVPETGINFLIGIALVAGACLSRRRRAQ